MKSVPVWAWLTGETEPILAGELRTDESKTGHFVYDESFMGREGAVPLDPIQLRFDRRRKGIPVAEHEGIPGVIRDACPAGYGAELITKRYDVGGDYSRNGTILPTLQLLELGADDAVGAIAACARIDRKLSRQLPTFSALSAEIALLEENQSPSRAIRNLSQDATSAGGERPKITLEDKGALWLVKMQDRNDIPFLPSKEYVCMSLASRCDIRIPEIRLEKVEGTYVFMIRRFDRDGDPRKPSRKMFASAKTALRLPPEAVKGHTKRSYLHLADVLKRWNMSAGTAHADVKELWKRMCFNALVGNSDDHPLNHGLLLEDGSWRLSPAYDITPLSRFAGVLSLSTSIDGSTECSPGRLLAAAPWFGVDADESVAWLQRAANLVANQWEDLLIEHGLPRREIDAVRPAFAISTAIAQGKHNLAEEASQAARPSARRRSSIIRKPSGSFSTKSIPGDHKVQQ